MSSKNGPNQTIILNSIVDPRSVYVAIRICDKLVEAVCDCGASVSCLSPAVFDDLRKSNGIRLQNSTKSLKAANGLPIKVKGVIRVPLKVGEKCYEHEFHVLENSETECLLGLDFLEVNKCDPLFSRMELRLDPTHSVSMYHKKFEYYANTVFRVVATENTLVPAGHTKVLPAHIPQWKRPPTTLHAIFEPQDRFSPTEDISAPNILFNFSDEVIPIAIENKTAMDKTIYKNTTLGFSEIVSDETLQNARNPQEAPPVKQLNKYDLRNVTTSIDKNLPSSIQKQFNDLIYEYKDIFSKNEWDLGKCDAIAHSIEVYPGSKPVKLPNRRLPIHYKRDLQQKVDVFLEKDLIAPCHSPYSAPAMLVPKKEKGKLRLVIDYRLLNKQTIKTSWPIPSIEEIFDTLEDSAYFTTIDMSWGFYQVPMEPDSQKYTAFSTPFGSFKWLRMPMGLTGSPGTFQNLMEKVLVGLTWKTCVPYLDDCIIFSRTPEEHISRLREIFQRFRDANLKVNPAKCNFFRNQVQFLGHIVSKDGLQADPEKVAAVKNFPTPKTHTDAKSFLGLASYYRRYVPNFAAIAEPLHKAAEKSSPFKWTAEAQDAFDSLKDRLTTTPILAFPRLHLPFILYTDASQFAMGAVLAQVQDGLERAICYASKAFSKSQTKYSTTRRELLSIVTFTRFFRHYLLGRKFTLVTDHRALQWLHNFKDPDGITTRWLEKLAPFEYDVRYRPGKSIGHADGLSRIPSSNINAISEDSQNEVLPTEDNTLWEHSSNEQRDEEDHASVGSEDWPNRNPSANASAPPEVEIAPKLYHELHGNLFHSTDSIAHCVSADFKLSAGIARKIRRKYPTQYPSNIDHVLNPLFPQWLPEEKRYIYHLITKQKFHNKPTYSTLRSSLEHMRIHAESNGISRISLPCIGSGLDKLSWPMVRQLIQEVFRTSSVVITVYTQESDSSTPDTAKPAAASDNPMAEAQKADESLKNVRVWVEKQHVPRNNELQGLPRLGWQMYNQLGSLYLHDDVLCRKFEPLNGSEPYLQQIVPPALVSEIISSLHGSTTAGHLGTHKTIEKIRQRFYWPGFKEDVKHYIRCCEPCQKRAGPPKTHRHSLVEWQPSYPFHHIGLDFLGPLPLSNGNKYIMLIGDHFTKWYEAIPLPNQKAETTADALLNNWISRFGCPHSIHTDQGKNFESHLFQDLMRRLQINKTRTTAFHPQSNSVIERMNRTLLNMLSKCIDHNQTNWSTMLPFVMMAYRSSVHESTGFTPHYLVFGNEMSLPLDLMYTPPLQREPIPLTKYVIERQEALRKSFELARQHMSTQQIRRNSLYNNKAHGPVYKEGDYVLRHYPATPKGHSPKLTCHWRGPYRITKCINTVNYKIKEVSTGKELVVHYDKLKHYHGPVKAPSLIPERNAAAKNDQKTKQRVPFDHSQCENISIYNPFPSTLFYPSAPIAPIAPSTSPHHNSFTRPLTPHSGTPQSMQTLTHASTIPARSPHSPKLTTPRPTEPSVAESPLPPNRQQIQFGELAPSIPVLTHSSPLPHGNFPRTSSFVESPRVAAESSFDSSLTTRSNVGNSTLERVIQGASRQLSDHQQREHQSTTQRRLRSNTLAQRKAEPLFKARFPRELLDIVSPRRPKKRHKP